MAEIPQPNLAVPASGSVDPEPNDRKVEPREANAKAQPTGPESAELHANKAETNPTEPTGADLQNKAEPNEDGADSREAATSEADSEAQSTEPAGDDLPNDKTETSEVGSNPQDGKTDTSHAGAKAQATDQAGADKYEQEEAALQAEEHILAIRAESLELDQIGFQLQRRKLEARLRIGKHVDSLHKLSARPGTGDFVKNIERAGLAITSAYRYRDEYLASLRPQPQESYPTGKDSPKPAAASTATGGLTPQGQVQNSEDLSKGQGGGAKPTPDPKKKYPILKFGDAELLEYRFYVEKLGEHFRKEIPSREERQIVLQALRSVANELGEEYAPEDLKTAA